ncbi:NAD(P)H-hydrate dehydratase [Methylobacterium sp. A54F]
MDSSAAPITPHLLRRMPIPAPQADSKDARGRVLVTAGCVEVPGPALLSATAAMRVGAGKVQIAACRDLAIPLGLAMPEARVFGLPQASDGGISESCAGDLAGRAERCDAALIGPGMFASAATRRIAATLLRLASGTGFVLDAGALSALPPAPDLTRSLEVPAVITPHAGEMAQLLGQERTAIEVDPLEAARAATERFGTVTLMKGAGTYVVAPGGAAWLYDAGHVGLATAGSGDVLAGLIAGLMARGTGPIEAALWGVYLHGEAGRRLARRYGGPGFLSREISGEVPGLLAEALG